MSRLGARLAVVVAAAAMMGGTLNATTAAQATPAVAAVHANTPAGVDTMVQARHSKRHCVTRREFRKVKRGWKRTRVTRKFDTSGRFVDGFAGGYTRGYHKCAGGRAYVSYLVRHHTARMAEKRWRAHY